MNEQDNMAIYHAVAQVPPEAQREINSGRLKGKTDINPQWRIKKLTELFGACGTGWKYEVVRFWLEKGAGVEVAAFAQINLYYKQGEEWSDPVPGIGGSAFVAQERNGPHTSDECYKMAMTDAISVAAKALGVGGSIYWNKDPTKYTSQTPKVAVPSPRAHVYNALVKRFGKEQAAQMLYTVSGYKSLKEIPEEKCEEIIKTIAIWEEPGKEKTDIVEAG